MNINPFRKRNKPSNEASFHNDPTVPEANGWAQNGGTKKAEAPAIIISGDLNITLVIEGSTHAIGPNHSNHTEILEAIRNEDWLALPDLVDVPAAIANYSSGNVIVNEFGEVTYKGAEVHSVISSRITKFFKDGLPFMPLVNFLDNLMANPSRRAVEELYGFLENEGMPITEDGCFIGYKGVNDNFTDRHTGKFDNSPGQILEMERNEVDDDARRHCSNGFHVGALSYAKGFGTTVLIVKVNPADAVAVPTDDARKLRVCRYEVMEVAEGLIETPMYVEPQQSIQQSDHGYTPCPMCGDMDDYCECCN